MLMTERKLNKVYDMVSRKERHKREVEIIEFYALAQKYGFCTPFCECGLCVNDIKDAIL